MSVSGRSVDSLIPGQNGSSQALDSGTKPTKFCSGNHSSLPTPLFTANGRPIASPLRRRDNPPGAPSPSPPPWAPPAPAAPDDVAPWLFVDDVDRVVRRGTAATTPVSGEGASEGPGPQVFRSHARDIALVKGQSPGVGGEALVDGALSTIEHLLSARAGQPLGRPCVARVDRPVPENSAFSRSAWRAVRARPALPASCACAQHAKAPWRGSSARRSSGQTISGW